MKQYDDSTHKVITKDQYKKYLSLIKLEVHYKKAYQSAKIIFSAWHKEMRDSLSLSKQEFADVFGLDRMSVHRYEMGQMLPRDVEFYKDMVEEYYLKQLILKLEKGRKNG
jgi:DNA-binding transcriptional regulator YiaG